MTRLTLIVVCAFVLIVCTGSGSAERVLFDFESDAELDLFYWKCHTLFTLSDEYATHGNSSLKLQLYPSDYPGLQPMLDGNDWRNYETFCFDIYNPERETLQIHVRIDDRKDYPEFGERYNETFTIQPGLNQVRIPLKTLITSGTKRTLNLENIRRLFIFMIRPENRAVLYVDYLRIESSKGHSPEGEGKKAEKKGVFQKSPTN